MAYNNGFPDSYQNGYQQNNYPQYSYNQQQQYMMPQSYQNTANYATTIPQTNNNQSNVLQQQQNNIGIIWVQGEAGAKAYPLAPNNKVLLMDSEAPVLYVKSVNTSGIPDPLLIYDLVERKDTQIVQNEESTDRIKEIEERLDKIENKLQNNIVNNNINKQNTSGSNKQRRNNNG